MIGYLKMDIISSLSHSRLDLVGLLVVDGSVQWLGALALYYWSLETVSTLLRACLGLRLGGLEVLLILKKLV
jgi:hypothetical protein